MLKVGDLVTLNNEMVKVFGFKELLLLEEYNAGRRK